MSRESGNQLKPLGYNRIISAQDIMLWYIMLWNIMLWYAMVWKMIQDGIQGEYMMNGNKGGKTEDRGNERRKEIRKNVTERDENGIITERESL